MFTTTCGACGTVAQFDESEVPPSGMVTTCASCGSGLSVVPPGMGLTSPPTAEQSEEIIDLPAPRSRVPREDAPDLLAPLGPTPRKELPDLLAPVGPKPTRQPARPVPPPPPGRPAGVPENLLAPVGPIATKSLPDLLEPVGPVPTKNLPDLLEPVGPTPLRNAPDLLEPLGPTGRGPGDALAPVGPRPTRGPDLPAPKGFFDEAPPPAPAHAARGMDEGTGFEPLDDELDVVPAGGGDAGFQAEVEAGLRDHSYAGPAPQQPFDESGGLGLEAEPPPPSYEDPAAYGQVDLPNPPPDDGLVSFSAPTGRAARPESVDLVEAPKRPRGTMAGEEARPVIKSVAATSAAPGAEPQKKRGRKALWGALAGLALLGGAGAYVYTSVELTVFGVMTQPAQERQASIARGLAETRRLLSSSDAGHWSRASLAADRVTALDPTASEAKALSAQAHAAAAYEEGLQSKADKDKADQIISAVLKAGGRGHEVEKAVALRSLLTPGKANDALGAFENVERASPTDPDAPLFAGWAALEAGVNDKAVTHFEAALKLRPDRQPALVGLGRAELARGDTAKAKEAFQRVFDKYPDRKHFGAWLALVELETTPRDPTGKRERELAVLCDRAPERESANPRDRARALTLYGDEAMAAGRWAQAAERYRLALSFDERSLDGLVGSALALVEQRTHSEANVSLIDARKMLEAALRVDPKQVSALIGLVRIDLLENRPADAQKEVASALEAGEKNPLVHFWRAKVLEDPAIGNLDEAEKAYQRAMELAPGDYTAYVALSQLDLGRARAAEKLGRKADAKTFTDKAVAVLGPIADSAKTDKVMANILGAAYLGARDTVHAEQWFRGALVIDPTYVDARANLASTLEAEGKLPDATAEWERAYQAAPKREDVALALAGADERGRNFAGADKLYAALLSTDGGNVPSARAQAGAGRYYARRGEIDLARKQADALSAVDPGHPAAIFLRGYIAANDGRAAEAEKLFHDALALDPQAQYWEALGRMHEGLKALGDAQTDYEQALKLDASYAPALLGLGRVHVARRKWQPALDALHRAVELDPTPDETWAAIGDASAGLRNLGDAASAYLEALKRNEKNGFTHYKLAVVYYDQNQSSLAAAQFKEAVTLGVDEPWLPDALRRLAYSYQAAGDHENMCVYLKRYVEIAKLNDPMLKPAKQARAGCP
jgi:tetratricopeptide (TPR) repeat protein